MNGAALRPRSSTTRWFAALCAAALFAGGCVSEKPETRYSAPGVARDEGTQMIMPQKFDADRQPVIPAGADNPDVNPDKLTDPCAARLHDVAGALLLYYRVKQQMPPKLEDVRSLGSIAQDLEFSCARNGAPFVYVPNGMASGGKEQRIIAFDPTPVGRPRFRWCLIASVSNSGALITDVVPLEEKVFNTYHAAPPADAPPQQPTQQQPAGQ